MLVKRLTYRYTEAPRLYLCDYIYGDAEAKLQSYEKVLTSSWLCGMRVTGHERKSTSTGSRRLRQGQGVKDFTYDGTGRNGKC